MQKPPQHIPYGKGHDIELILKGSQMAMDTDIHRIPGTQAKQQFNKPPSHTIIIASKGCRVAKILYWRELISKTISTHLPGQSK